MQHGGWQSARRGTLSWLGTRRVAGPERFVVLELISSPLHRNCGAPLMCCIDDALCAWIFQLDRRATQISIALMIA